MTIVLFGPQSMMKEGEKADGDERDRGRGEGEMGAFV